MDSEVMERAIKVAERRFLGGQPYVMVALSRTSENRTRRHVTLKRDADGLYVRLGKRGLAKRYLSQMSGARFLAARLDIVVFYESGEVEAK